MSQHEMIAVPREMRADFVYIATGNGMAGYGIQSGDDVYIRQQETADNGDIVAILVEGDVLLRRYHRSNGLDVFSASDPALATIITDPGTWPKIVGKAVGLTRYLEREEANREQM